MAVSSNATTPVLEVAEHIYRLRLPMPYELDHVHAYLIKETNRLAVVDCGLDLADSWESLLAGFAALNLHPADLTDIFITHSHPDHIGALARLREVAPEAKLYLHRREYQRMSDRASDPATLLVRFSEWLSRNGATDFDPVELLGIDEMLPPTLHSTDQLVEGREHVPLAATALGDWQILWTPGHTSGHFVLHNAARQLLLSGDHLLTSISSNIGKYPGSTDDPLGDFIGSLEAIAQLDLVQVLPAHGQPLEDYRDRITHLIEHHRKRLGKIYAALEGQPRTAAQLVGSIWGNRLVGVHRYLALVEILSHLELLRREGRVQAEETTEFIYYRAI